MKRNNSKLRGMTLLEVIVAMVILVIGTTMVATGASSVVQNVRTSRHVVSKVNEQVGAVENRRVAGARMDDTGALVTGHIHLSYAGTPGDLFVEQFDAPTTQVPADQRVGDLKYFANVTTN